VTVDAACQQISTWTSPAEIRTELGCCAAAAEIASARSVSSVTSPLTSGAGEPAPLETPAPGTSP
jgi:hypothetical protein